VIQSQLCRLRRHPPRSPHCGCGPTRAYEGFRVALPARHNGVACSHASTTHLVTYCMTLVLFGFRDEFCMLALEVGPACLVGGNEIECLPEGVEASVSAVEELAPGDDP
jgi:hypothetical protein